MSSKTQNQELKIHKNFELFDKMQYILILVGSKQDTKYKILII